MRHHRLRAVVESAIAPTLCRHARWRSLKYGGGYYFGRTFQFSTDEFEAVGFFIDFGALVLRTRNLAIAKRIAHELRTQYVDGIYSNSVNLKSSVGTVSYSQFIVTVVVSLAVVEIFSVR